MINEDFLKQFNGFYNQEKTREVLLDLFNHTCQGCNTNLFLNSEYHVGHIIPRSKPKDFAVFFEKLDVDNIINLNPLCSKCNLSVSDNSSSPAILNRIFSSNYRIIKNNLNIINREKGTKFYYYEPDISFNTFNLTLNDIFTKNYRLHDKNIIDDSLNDILIYNNDLMSAISLSNFNNEIKNKLLLLEYQKEIFKNIYSTFLIKKENGKYFKNSFYINTYETPEKYKKILLQIEDFFEQNSEGVDEQSLKQFLSSTFLGDRIYENIIKRKTSYIGFTVCAPYSIKKAISIFNFTLQSDLYKIKKEIENKDIRVFYNISLSDVIHNLRVFELQVIKFFDYANNINLKANRRFHAVLISDILKFDMVDMKHQFMDYYIEDLINIKSLLDFLEKHKNINESYINKLEKLNINKAINSIIELIYSFNQSQGTLSEKKFRQVYKDLEFFHKQIKNVYF